jgi:hypothetical protein
MTYDQNIGNKGARETDLLVDEWSKSSAEGE